MGIDMIVFQKLPPVQPMDDITIDVVDKVWLRRNVRPYEAALLSELHVLEPRMIEDLPGYIEAYGIKRIESPTFAGLATLLAAVGLYAVLAFSVTQRQRELGVRLALGATPRQMRLLVFGEDGKIAAIGAVIGLVAALTLGRLAQSLLFGLSGSDPFALASAVTIMGAVALVATYLPARRASRIGPMEALRHE